MISHSHKFIFIHINRTGGTSVEHALSAFGGVNKWEDFNRHDGAGKISEKPEWNDYFKFSIVRNPWDKEFSDYKWHKKLKHKKVSEYSTFKDYLRLPEQTKGKGLFRWHSNQYDWLISKNGKLEIDFVARFENLQEDFYKICQNINIDPISLPHKNKTKKLDYRQFYTDETYSWVKANYKKDIDYFNYKF